MTNSAELNVLGGRCEKFDEVDVMFCRVRILPAGCETTSVYCTATSYSEVLREDQVCGGNIFHRSTTNPKRFRCKSCGARYTNSDVEFKIP